MKSNIQKARIAFKRAQKYYDVLYNEVIPEFKTHQLETFEKVNQIIKEYVDAGLPEYIFTKGIPVWCKAGMFKTNVYVNLINGYDYELLNYVQSKMSYEVKLNCNILANNLYLVFSDYDDEIIEVIEIQDDFFDGGMINIKQQAIEKFKSFAEQTYVAHCSKTKEEIERLTKQIAKLKENL